MATKRVLDTEVVMEQHDVTTVWFALLALSDGAAPLMSALLLLLLFCLAGLNRKLQMAVANVRQNGRRKVRRYVRWNARKYVR